jgi:O-antigen/teichoic acid export membrane protein
LIRPIGHYKKRLTEDPRLARMLHGGLSGIVVRGFAMLVSLITLPLNVRYLGKVEYGIWVTISSSVVMLSVLDLGIASTLTNFISEAFAEDDRPKAQGYFATAFWMTVAVAAVLATLCGIAWALIDWGRLLGIAESHLAYQASLCVAIAIGFLLIGLPLNLANRVLAGYQQVHIGNYFQMINSVLGLVAIVSVVLTRGTIVDLMLTYCSAMLVGSLLLNVWLSFFSKPWIKPDPRKASLARARQLFGQGALFFVLQLTSIVVFNSDNLVITHFRGPAEVTPYSIAWRLVNYATLFQVMLVPSFWPAFTEAYRKRELAWMRSMFDGMMRKTLMFVAAASVVLALAGQTLIRVWAGPAAVPSMLLLWTMASWAIVSSITTNQAMLLTATGRLKVEAGVAVLAAVANLGLSIFLVDRIGAEGVILATVLSFAVFMIVPQGMEANRVLRGDFLPDNSVPETPAHLEAREHALREEVI